MTAFQNHSRSVVERRINSSNVRDAMLAHEALQPAPLDVLRSRSPDDFSAKLEPFHCLGL